MGIETLVVIWVVLWIIPCMLIARAKNKSVDTAFGASLLFGPFALVYYIFARSELPKKCAGCGAGVSHSDKFCPECGAKSEERTDCPKCKTHNKKNFKFCTKCGYNLIKEPELEFICDHCNKKFKSEEALSKHYGLCEKKKTKEKNDNKEALWAITIIMFVSLGMYFFFTNKINLAPLLLIGFIATPFFDKLFNHYKMKSNRLKHFEFNWWKKGMAILAIISLFIFINWLIPECPKSCNDDHPCTNDFCSSETGYKCMNTLKLNCKGNGICESGEYGTSDCPNCDDNNKCTADSYDAASKQCIHVEMKGCIQ